MLALPLLLSELPVDVLPQAARNAVRLSEVPAATLKAGRGVPEALSCVAFFRRRCTSRMNIIY